VVVRHYFLTSVSILRWNCHWQ